MNARTRKAAAPEAPKPKDEPVIEQASAEAQPETTSEAPAADQAPEPDVVVTESGAVQPVAIINITHLHVAQMTPEIEEGDTEMPTQHAEGSITQFKGLDRRTMRLAMTDKGLRAVVVESEANNV